MSVEVYDGFMSQEGGMNGGFRSSLLQETQYHKGLNVTCRGGAVRTRPPVRELTLQFPYSPDQRTFQYRRFQGAYVYHATHASYLCCGIGGNVYFVDVRTGIVTDVSQTTGRFSQYAERLYFCQAEKYLIIQDGINGAIICDGVEARAADNTENEVPRGTIMAYGHGRLFLCTGKNEFIAGDIYKSNEPGSHLKFTETTYLAGGGSFSLPTEMGDITGMTFVRNFESSGTGNGPLLVFGENGYGSYNVYLSRVDWQGTDIARIESIGQGAASASAIVQMNEDVMYRTWTGLRSHTFLENEVSSRRAFTELAEEIRPFLDQETSWMTPYCSAVQFDNRLLFTIIGQKVTALDEDDVEVDDYRFRGIAALDFQPVSGITVVSKNVSAAWDGMWTGMNPTAIVAGLFDQEERCFIFGKTDGGINVLYELKKGSGMDNGDVPISCRLYTRAMPYKRPSENGMVGIPYRWKTLQKIDMWIREIEGDVELKAWVRPDNRGIFTEMATETVHAPVEDFSNPVIGIPEPGRTQSRPKFTFHAPSWSTDQYQKEGMNHGAFFEFCLEWSGLAEFLRFGTTAVDQEAKDLSTKEPEVAIRFTEFERSDYSYDLQRRIA